VTFGRHRCRLGDAADRTFSRHLLDLTGLLSSFSTLYSRNSKSPTTQDKLETLRHAALKTASELGSGAAKNITGALNSLLADVFALYVKTKNFHWHVSGPHFRDYHLLLDEHAGQICEMTDDIAGRVRKIGGITIRSIGNIARLQRLSDNDVDYVDPLDMLAELCEDNGALLASTLQPWRRMG